MSKEKKQTRRKTTLKNYKKKNYKKNKALWTLTIFTTLRNSMGERI